MTTITTQANAALSIAERLWFTSVEHEVITNTPGSDADTLRTIAVELRQAARHSEKGRDRKWREHIEHAAYLCGFITDDKARRMATSQIVALRSM